MLSDSTHLNYISKLLSAGTQHSHEFLAMTVHFSQTSNIYGMTLRYMSVVQNTGVGSIEGDGATGGHAGRLEVPMNAKRGLGSVEGEGAIDTGGHAGLLENVLVNGGPNTSVGLGSIDGDGAAGGQLSCFE